MASRSTAALALLASLSASTGCGSPKPTAVPEAEARAIALPFEDYRLPNGLRVVLSEDHRAPVASIVVTYAVGSREDPPGKSGLAHLFEHALFEGVGALTADELLRKMDEAGQVGMNAQTSMDSTQYLETVSTRGLPFALWMEASRMAFAGATFTQAKLDRVRGVVEEERKERYENAPYGNVPELIAGALYPAGHPYARYPIGTVAELESITVDDVKRFHATHYTPDTATIVVVGDLDRAACKRMIEADFGPIPRGTATPLPTPAVTAPAAKAQVLTIRADVAQPRTYLAWVTPPETDRNAALVGIAHAVAGGVRERMLGARLVESGWSHLDAHALGGVFIAEFTPTKGTSTDALDEELTRWFPRYRQYGLDQELLDGWRRHFVSTLLDRLDDTLQRAEALASGATSAEGPAQYAGTLQRLQAATLTDAWQVTNDVLATGHRVVAHVVVDPSAPRAGALVVGQ